MDQSLIQTMIDVDDRHWWHVARRDILVAAAQRATSGSPGAILDIGCGTGGNLAALRDALGATRAVGLDRNDECVEVARGRGLEIVRGEGASLQFADGEFDFVSALDVLEHLEDEVAGAREIGRVLSPQGTALITVPAYEWLWGPYDELNAHKRRYTRDRLVSALEGAGLEVTYSTYFNTYLFPIAAAGRLAERVAHRDGGASNLPSAGVNSALLSIFRSERARVARGKTLPYGLSVLATARHRAP
jgi:ubiquinone/menaquinone biosynthesis C-methylase UbiE